MVIVELKSQMLSYRAQLTLKKMDYIKILEGRVQECRKASYPAGEAIESWKVFNKINKCL